MVDPFQLPPPPDQAQVVQWTSEIRAFVILLSGMGIGGSFIGRVTDAQIGAYVTAGLTIVSLVVYCGARFQAATARQAELKATRASTVATAVQSAQTGTPVVVTVTPPGQPNIARLVSPAEVASAPAVN